MLLLKSSKNMDGLSVQLRCCQVSTSCPRVHITGLLDNRHCAIKCMELAFFSLNSHAGGFLTHFSGSANVLGVATLRPPHSFMSDIRQAA